MLFWSLDWEDPLEEGMATHSSVLAWRIPWTEEPGGLQSTGSHRFGHDWSDLARSTLHSLRPYNCSVVEPSSTWDSYCSYAMLCYAKSLQSCPTLCDPIDGSPPGSPVPGIVPIHLQIPTTCPSPMLCKIPTIPNIFGPNQPEFISCS